MASESIDGFVTYSLNGHASQYPVGSEVSLRLVREAVKEFFFLSGGRRPGCVQWQVDV